jgi:hypothetical protein
VTASIVLAHARALRFRFDRDLGAGTSTPLTLALSERAHRSLTRAFSRHRQLTARLTAIPRGAGGVDAAVRLRVRILA